MNSFALPEWHTMPKVRLQRRVRHKPDDLLKLVVDVEQYPIFINLIPAVRIISRETTPVGENFIADVKIQYKMISETFRSKVEVNYDEKTLRIAKAGHGGAVRNLKNTWDFSELPDGSTMVDLRLEVSLKLMPLEMLIRSKMDTATSYILNAFERRAAQIYPLVGEDPEKLGA